MDSIPHPKHTVSPLASQHGITNNAAGSPRSTQSTVLETAAAATQSFAPLKQICAHLNAFHVYTTDPSRCVESNHYCAHLNEDVRQCLIYDTPEPNARLIGIEYMISPKLYDSLPQEERKLWHSHVYEVKSGLLIMPKPAMVPTAVWEAAERKEMEQVVGLYGKTYHFWQVDRGDVVPMGEAQLMGSFTGEEQMGAFEGAVNNRDERYGIKREEKAKGREYIEEPVISEDADQMWKGSSGEGSGEKDAWGEGTGHARSVQDIHSST